MNRSTSRLLAALRSMWSAKAMSSAVLVLRGEKQDRVSSRCFFSTIPNFGTNLFSQILLACPHPSS